MRNKDAKVKELVQTEENYLEFLKKIQAFLTGDMKSSFQDRDFPVQMPPDFRPHFEFFQKTFQQVFEFHDKVWTEQLRSCVHTPEQFVDLFNKVSFVVYIQGVPQNMLGKLSTKKKFIFSDFVRNTD